MGVKATTINDDLQMMSHEGDDEDGLDNDRMVLFGQCSAD